MKLLTNQVINLFELGTTDENSPAFDMQDNVVKVTLVRAGEDACLAGGSDSQLVFKIHDEAKIHYSSEAIAKLGKVLDTIRHNTDVRVTRNLVMGYGKDEGPAYDETMAVDDQEDHDEQEAGSDQMTVCHKPKGGRGTATSIKQKRLGKHIGHGDYVGTCTGWDPDDDN